MHARRPEAEKYNDLKVRIAGCNSCMHADQKMFFCEFARFPVVDAIHACTQTRRVSTEAEVILQRGCNSCMHADQKTGGNLVINIPAGDAIHACTQT